MIAGGRRLIALKKLARAGTIPADLPVPCLVLTEADSATEISLAENQVRETMHPDDQCGAFQTLLAEGLPVEDIAARFGVMPAVVTQRLRLAAVSPKLRALYRAGDTTLAHMMALTLPGPTTGLFACCAGRRPREGRGRRFVATALPATKKASLAAGPDRQVRRPGLTRLRSSRR